MEDQLRLGIDEADALRPLWDEALERVRPEVGNDAVEGWLRDLSPSGLQRDVLTVAAANATARSWIERKYQAPLARSLTAIRGMDTTVEIVVRKGTRGARPRPAVDTNGVPAPRATVSPLFAPLPLNEKYRFENYVVGQSNRFAQAAAAAVAERPGREFNPLFIYGGVGLGKTHLLQAVGHALLARTPRARVAYVSGETFTGHFITSLREHREEEFRRAYRGIDIWLVDDIQFIADKTSTKEEFFHTFNELYLTNKQIVLASDRPPRELRLMEERLRTRLESGLMVEIGAPDLETRIAILQKRAEGAEGLEIPSEVLYHIAYAVTDNIRLLEAALIRLMALASLTRSNVTAELAARALGAFVQESRAATISEQAIQQAVCRHFNVSEAELMSASRTRQICLARQTAMYLMRELSRKTLVDIGELFGGKAHSTVLYACDKLHREMKEDPALASAVRGLRAELANAGHQP